MLLKGMSERVREAQGEGRVRGLAARWEEAGAAVATGNGQGGGGRPHISRQQMEAVLYDMDPEDELEDFTQRDTYGGSVQAVAMCTARRGPLTMVCKTAPARTPLGKMVNAGELFRREAAMYGHVIPHLSQLWIGNPLNIFPRCYYTSPHLIVLEDLAAAGYSIVRDGDRSLDVQHCSLVMAAVARLHAASFALKEADPHEAARILSEVGNEPVFVEERCASLEATLASSAKATVSALHRCPKTSTLADRVHRILQRRLPRLVQLQRAIEPMAVLLHGDLRTHNLLFHYDDAGTPDAVRLIDLQMCRYGSPALDINRLLYSSGRRDARTLHGDSLVRTYHRHLCKALAQLQVRPPCSLADMRTEVHAKALYGLLTADIPSPDDYRGIEHTVLELDDLGLLNDHLQ